MCHLSSTRPCFFTVAAFKIGNPSREKSLSCKILQDSGRILQDDASSYKNLFQNLTRSYKIHFFLQESYKIHFFCQESYKIHFFFQESYKIHFFNFKFLFLPTFFRLYLALHCIAKTSKKLRKAMISCKKVIRKAIVLYLQKSHTLHLLCKSIHSIYSNCVFGWIFIFQLF